MSPRSLFESGIEGPGLEVRVHREAFSPAQADDHLAGLRAETDWQQDHVKMFGKETLIPRLTAWYGDKGAGYTYSGIPMEPLPWTDRLVEIRRNVSDLAEASFNSVLLNLYRGGNDGVGWHADDEPELGTEPVIGSASLGASRRFQLRRRDDPSVKRELEVRHGDVVVMSGSTQRLWQHQVPKTSRPVGERINLTFRYVDTSP